MPDNNALESVRRTALVLRVAIRRQASDTIVLSGIVKAFDSLSCFTLLSLDPGLLTRSQLAQASVYTCVCVQVWYVVCGMCNT